MSLRFCPFKSFFFFDLPVFALSLCELHHVCKSLEIQWQAFPIGEIDEVQWPEGQGSSSPLLGLHSDPLSTPQSHRIHHSICCSRMHSCTHAHTHTHTGLAVDNIRAVWVGRNRSCFNSCPNGWYRVAQVSLLLQGPPLTCCYIMLACVLFGSVWYSVVG